MNNKKFSEYSNEEKVIFYIAKFGWLRIYDIGQLVWQNSNDENAYRYASDIIKKLKDDGFVKTTLLKKRRGMAVNLTKSGGRYARQLGFFPTIARDDWRELSTAEHDLLTILAFTYLVKKENFCAYRFMADAELKRASVESTNEILDYNGEVKIPDLICYEKHTNSLVSFEVECKSKTGDKNKAPLINSIVRTNTSIAPYRFDSKFKKVQYQPDSVAIAYNPGQRAPNGKKVSNLTNIVKSLLEKMNELNLERLYIRVLEVVPTETMRIKKAHLSRVIRLYKDDTRENFIQRIEYDKEDRDENGVFDPDMF